MIFRKMTKILGLILSFSILIVSNSFAVNNDFAVWKNSFKKRPFEIKNVPISDGENHPLDQKK